MTGRYTYLRDLPDRLVLLLERPPEDDPLGPSEHRWAVVDDDVFWGVSDYTRSQPTSPSAGRIYRKNLGWPADMPDSWWLYLVIDDPSEGGHGQLHVPYRVELVP